MSLSFSPDARLLVSGGNDNTARIWDVGARAELHRFSGGSTGGALFVANVRFSPDGKAIAFSSMTWKAEGAGRFTPAGSRLVIGDAASGAEIRSIAVQTSFVSGLAFSPDGKTVVSAGDGVVKLWDVATGAERRVLKTGDLRALCVSPDGEWLAYAAKGGVRLIGLEGTPLPVSSSPPPGALFDAEAAEHYPYPSRRPSRR